MLQGVPKERRHSSIGAHRRLKVGKGKGSGKRGESRSEGKGIRSAGKGKGGKGKGGSYRTTTRNQQRPIVTQVVRPQHTVPQYTNVAGPIVYDSNIHIRPAPIPMPNPILPPPVAPRPPGGFAFVPSPVGLPQDNFDLSTQGANCEVSVAARCQLEGGAACTSLQSRSTNCDETVYYTFRVCNTGNVDLSFSTVDFIFNGFSTDVLDIGQIEPDLLAGACAVLDPNTVINACENEVAESSLIVSGFPSNNRQLSCQASDTDSFTPSAVAGGQQQLLQARVSPSTVWVAQSTWDGLHVPGGRH